MTDDGSAESAVQFEVVLSKSLPNGVVLQLVLGSVADSTTEAVVNAANANSFTPIDSGVSGTLRDACGRSEALAATKFRLVDGQPAPSVEPLQECEVCYQESSGALREQGVKYVLHALGPNWINHEPQEEGLLDTVGVQIASCMKNALDMAASLGASSITLPALSGGIFTHKAFDDESRALHDAEQRRSRLEVVQGAVEWARANPMTALRSISLMTPQPGSQPSGGARRRQQAEEEVQMFREAMEA